MTSEDAQRLAAAIIRQAVDDYLAAERIARNAKRAKRDAPAEHDELWHKADKVQRQAEWSKQEVVRFIRSDWFAVLTDIDPERLIERLKQLRGRRIKQEGTT